jgi:hypothetical protein
MEITMDKQRARQLYELADRLSKLDVNTLSEEQHQQRNTMIAKLQEEVKTIKEFAPDDGSGGEEDTLHKYARMWYNGNDATQQQVEQILDRMGWGIGEIESEEGGAFVVQTGDENGNSYIGFAVADLSEGITDNKDAGEYDQEGDMARQDLATAANAAEELRSILDSDENLPEWVQSKITKAVDYLDTVRDYMKSKDQDVSEGSQQVDSLVTDALKIMRGSDYQVDAVKAIKTVLGDREYNSRRGYYSFYVKQLMDMHGQEGIAETKKPSPKLTPVDMKKSEPVSEEINTEAYERLQKVFAFKNYES